MTQELEYERDSGEAGEQQADPIEIPYAELSPEALRGVAEAFVLREGTDYGERECPFDVKVEQVLRQVRDREARIVFDPGSETVDIQMVGPGRTRT
jgi:uncharacterized protein YheU (UPF0270 family)